MCVYVSVCVPGGDCSSGASHGTQIVPLATIVVIVPDTVRIAGTHTSTAVCTFMKNS